MSKKRIRATLDDAGPRHPNLSRWQLPATAEAYEQMVEQMAQAMLCGIGYEPMVRRALRAIGIKPIKK